MRQAALLLSLTVAGCSGCNDQPADAPAGQATNEAEQLAAAAAPESEKQLEDLADTAARHFAETIIAKALQPQGTQFPIESVSRPQSLGKYLGTPCWQVQGEVVTFTRLGIARRDPWLVVVGYKNGDYFPLSVCHFQNGTRRLLYGIIPEQVTEIARPAGEP